MLFSCNRRAVLAVACLVAAMPAPAASQSSKEQIFENILRKCLEEVFVNLSHDQEGLNLLHHIVERRCSVDRLQHMGAHFAEYTPSPETIID